MNFETANIPTTDDRVGIYTWGFPTIANRPKPSTASSNTPITAADATIWDISQAFPRISTPTQSNNPYENMNG